MQKFICRKEEEKQEKLRIEKEKELLAAAERLQEETHIKRANEMTYEMPSRQTAPQATENFFVEMRWDIFLICKFMFML